MNDIEIIYNKIYESIDKLNKLNISEDGVFDDNEKRILRENIENFKKSFDELKNLDVYESDETKIIRDKVADCLRKQALDLGNNLKDYKEALNINDFMELIVGTENYKLKIASEKNIIKKNLKAQTDPNYELDLIIMDLLIQRCDYMQLQKMLRNVEDPLELSMLVDFLNKHYNLDFKDGRVVYKSVTQGQGCFPVILIGLLLGLYVYTNLV